MSAISTHILDTVQGKPGAGIGVRLELMQGGGWIESVKDGEPHERVLDSPGGWVEVATGTTDSDGRCRNLAPDASAGLYRLTFDTGAYFQRSGRASIYPEIAITFRCDGEAHYHLPLLLSDNSYTTYRGS
ncbi:MAG: hydroxyisourate hydrolase [Terracidiphilus sp.]|jgi:5-hydroxyisourate hydrolase